MATAAIPIPDPTPDRPPRPRRWIPLSLRVFIAVLGILGVVIGWGGLQNYRQRSALQEIRPLGWSVRFRSRAPVWLLGWVGRQIPDQLGTVVAVYVDDSKVPRDDVVWTHGVRQCSNIIAHTTDAGLVHLKGLTTLEVLSLNDIKLTDAGLGQLGELTQLRKLSLDNTQVTDSGLAHLHGLTKLKRLSLRHTQTTDAGVAELKQALPDLTIIR